MRVLYLLRHGDAVPAAPGVDDHDRALAEAGREAVPRVLGRLSRGAVPPTLLLCSSARRAVETLELVLSRASGDPEVQIERSLYLAGSDDILERVQAVDARHRGLLVVAHNPGLGRLAHNLSRDGTGPDADRLQRGFAAGSLAVLHFDAADWCDVTPRRGELVAFTTPADVAATR